MTALTHSILSAETIRATYLLPIGILSGLVLFTLWRGRDAVQRELVEPLLIVIAAFSASRILVLGLVGHTGVGASMLFSLLNLIAFYGLALSIAQPVDSDSRSRANSSRELAGLRRQSLYFGLAIGLLFLVKVGDTSATVFIAGMINLAAIGASIRMIAFVFERVHSEFSRYRYTVLSTATLLATSWCVLTVAPLISGHGVMKAFDLAGFLDVSMLVLVLGGLMSNHVVMGKMFRNKASQASLEIDAAKEELAKLSNIATNIYEDSSDLIKKQKEQTLLYMKKAESLEKMLQIGVNIQRRHQLEDLLQMIVEAVRDHVGFKTVILRLLNKKSQNFDASAHVGLSDEAKDSVVNYRIPITEYQKMIEPRFRISRSYFIRKTNQWYGEDLNDEPSVLVKDTWRDIDLLIVPLLNEDQATIGYLSVENPENPGLSVPDVIETLEHVAMLAVIAIRNARFLRELEAKNEKLSVYADKLSGLNKLKANFVATVSHEFRTPLTSIKAYCETLLKNADTVQRDLLKQFLHVIEEESSRLMTLIDDILDFSKMESGAMKFERTPCELNAIARGAAADLAKNFEGKRITLKCELQETSVVVNGNGELLKQVMVNLLHNASKFTKEEGRVWLRVEEEPGSVRIVVEDDGIGIPDDQLARIFEQFYQVDNSSTRKHGGSGLGLAMCKGIVEWHDGRIWVENIAGRGARFVAVIPKKEAVVSSHVPGSSSTVSRFEIERFLELVVENIAEFMNVGKASLMLIDPEYQELRIESAIGMDEEIVANARVKLGEGIAGKVAQEGRTMLVENIEEDSRFTRSNNDLIYRSKSFLSVPIFSGNNVTGVVNAAAPLGRTTFTDEDRRLLETLVERLSIAVDKMRNFANASLRFEQVRETLKSIMELKRYIDLKNDDVVKSCVLKAAGKLGLPAEAKARLHYVMNVYDLGLSKVGFHIIKNPKDLSPKDREAIQKHTALGHEMLSSMEKDPYVGNIILCHHENFDGTGYPGKLKGEAIPIEARIIRVADSLRALISHRPYQKQYNLDEAQEVLKHRSGTFFDPKVVDALIEAMNESDELGKTAHSTADEPDEPVGEHR